MKDYMFKNCEDNPRFCKMAEITNKENRILFCSAFDKNMNDPELILEAFIELSDSELTSLILSQSYNVLHVEQIISNHIQKVTELQTGLNNYGEEL